jgi:hypothetical protein
MLAESCSGRVGAVVVMFVVFRWFAGRVVAVTQSSAKITRGKQPLFVLSGCWLHLAMSLLLVFEENVMRFPEGGREELKMVAASSGSQVVEWLKWLK